MNSIEQVQWEKDEFVVSTDPSLLDLASIHAFLARSYWAVGIPRELVEKSISHSLCFGIYVSSAARGLGRASEAGGLERASEAGGLERASEAGGSAGDPLRQIGFARVVSDHATFAYLADVYVEEEWRGRGLSKWLMSCILSHPHLQRLRRFCLGTRDAHELYKQYGFKVIQQPENWLEIKTPNTYQNQPLSKA